MWTANETYLEYSYGRSNKFYRMVLLQNQQTLEFRVLFNWGRIGATGQYKVELARTSWDAAEMIAAKAGEKEVKGYTLICGDRPVEVTSELLHHAAVNDRVEMAEGIRRPHHIDDEIADFLTEIAEVNAGVKRLSNYDALMDRYTELVRQADESSTTTVETEQGLAMAATALIALEGK